MQSRRDLFQAHRLMTRRAALALLRGEPDVPDQPLRRLNVAAFSGILVAAIVTVLFFMWGLLGHSGSPLKNQPGTLFIDKQTGQNYVFCDGGKLCPVLNYASARLALSAGASLNQQTVSQSAIAKFPQGPLIGIQGLPPLPDPGQLVQQPWSVCIQQVTFGAKTLSALSGGMRTRGKPLATTDALLAQAQGQDWVIWNGQRMSIKPDLLAVLHSSQSFVLQVPSVWLNALPVGPPFAAPSIPDPNTTAKVPGPTGGPAKVGQVYVVTGVTGPQFYVMLQRGYAPITQTQAELLLTSQSVTSTPATLSEVSSHLAPSGERIPRGVLPSTVPTVPPETPTVQLCVVYAGSGSSLTPHVERGGQLPRNGVQTDGSTGVDEVALPPETGALVGAEPDPGGTAIQYFLVADGHKYALTSTAVAGMLGYSLSQAVLLPGGVVDLIPQGPALNPGAATNTVPFSG